MCNGRLRSQRCAVLLILSLTLFSNLAFGYEPVDEELSYLYGDDNFVSIATGRKQLIAKAPAVASVITAKEIRAMGATDVDEVLESVAGLHVSRQASVYNPIFVIRGIHSDFNTQVLMLINGIPITNVYTGDRSQIWGGMPVENISRIEVIRGPGSAIYGADAFAGTINIVTKTAAEINGLESGVSTGSFDTHRAWLLYGGGVHDYEVAFSMELLDTNGQHEKIDADQQTAFDAAFGTSASLAPSGVNTGKKSIDTRVDVSKGDWRLRAGYQGRRDVGTGAGVNQALDPSGKGDSDRFNVDLTYHDADFSQNWDIQGTLSYFDSAFESELTLLPPGVVFPEPDGAFPDGLIGNPDVYERHYRYDAFAFYTGFESHVARIGAGYHYIDQYRIEESKNFSSGTGPPDDIFPDFLGGVMKVTGDDLFNREAVREVSYLTFQDEWQFATNWFFTTGVRYDHYSDFGSTINPRVALVWDTSYSLTTKLLYGRAFRAPSFAEQFNRNNPVAIGNDDLDPEVINTYELAFDYAYSPDLRAGLNLFYYKMEDIIRFIPVAQNTGNQTGKGFELEFEWEVDSLTRLKGNYAFQHSRDKEAGSAAANAPQQQVYLRLDRQLAPKWHLSGQLNSVMDRKRAAGDSRSEIDDYTTLDVTLRGSELLPGVTLSVSVFNLTDADAREPGLYDPMSGTVALPDDLPLAGRNVMLQVSKSW